MTPDEKKAARKLTVMLKMAAQYGNPWGEGPQSEVKYTYLTILWLVAVQCRVACFGQR
jgi:hypothetical protein